MFFTTILLLLLIELIIILILLCQNYYQKNLISWLSGTKIADLEDEINDLNIEIVNLEDTIKSLKKDLL